MSTFRPGAQLDGSAAIFTVWAAGHRSVRVEIEGMWSIELEPQTDGYFTGRVEGVTAGSRYRYRVDGGEPLPDLASRAQPDGSDGASMVVDTDFAWTDHDWRGIERHDQVLYELHVGTFTSEGTWRAAASKLKHLADIGITVIQVMPIGTFKGKFGWGYDTILAYAPFAPYGTPQDMAAFVDAAHAHGVGVILDVVYNHVGIGDHHRNFSDHYFTDCYENEWGASFNFDGESSGPVREFITQNAVYWVRDFHIDGLRLDATQAMFDSSDEHIIAQITREVRAAAGNKTIYVIAENHPQDRVLIEAPDTGGYGLDAIVSDDFQHTARVAMTGHNDFYYRDYIGAPQEMVSAMKYGFLYQGQRSDMREKPYGTYNLDTPAENFVHFLENHDQIANSARGFRLASLASPARIRALSTALLLGPQTPCLFQGQEFGATNPFFYFLGLEGQDAEAVSKGRRQSLTNFPSVQDPAMQDILPAPDDEKTFLTSKLDWAEAERHAGSRAFHAELLALRRSVPAFSQRTKRRIDGAVVGDHALLIRYCTDEASQHRLLLINLGRDLHVGVIAEPLLAPPTGHKWEVEFSSEHPRYDGAGRRPIDTDSFWILPADCAVVLASNPRPQS